MRIKTAVTELLNIDLPIIGAPMFLVSYPDLVVAVSEAGGIGTFPALNYRSVEELREGLAEMRERTDKPIGVNIILYKSHNPNWKKQLDACLDAKVELIITSLGTPKSVVKEAKSVGSKVFCDVTTLRHARIIARAGADGLIAVAAGAGGHAGTVTPFCLFPELKAELEIPVVGAGSIGTGAQMAAAMALGSDAVYVGTRLIASDEAKTDQAYKEMVVASQSADVVYTEKVSGIPANWLKASLDRLEVQPNAKELGDLQSEYKRWKDIWSAGQGVSQVDSIRPAGEIVREIAEGYLRIIENLPKAAPEEVIHAVS